MVTRAELYIPRHTEPDFTWSEKTLLEERKWARDKILEVNEERLKSLHSMRRHLRKAEQHEWILQVGGRVGWRGNIEFWDPDWTDPVKLGSNNPARFYDPEYELKQAKYDEDRAIKHAAEMGKLGERIVKIDAILEIRERPGFWEKFTDAFFWPFKIWMACRMARKNRG